jgi:hypothetical protein
MKTRRRRRLEYRSLRLNQNSSGVLVLRRAVDGNQFFRRLNLTRRGEFPAFSTLPRPPIGLVPSRPSPESKLKPPSPAAGAMLGASLRTSLGQTLKPPSPAARVVQGVNIRAPDAPHPNSTSDLLLGRAILPQRRCRRSPQGARSEATTATGARCKQSPPIWRGAQRKPAPPRDSTEFRFVSPPSARDPHVPRAR